MRNLSIIVTTLLLMLVSPWAQAVRVNSIYQAEVPVQSQSPQEKSRAAQVGLVQVLIKVSGNSQIVDSNPALKAELSQADKLAQEYSYTTPTTGTKSKLHILTIRYDVLGVNRLLQESGAPTWGQNRPLILVWLAFEGPNHSPDIVDSSVEEMQAAIKHSAKQRGLPVMLPVMDVTDLGLISVNDVMTKSVTALQTASQRYNSDAMLIGHVMQVNEDFTSQWRLVIGTDQWNWEIRGKTLDEVLSGVMNNVADTMVARYASVMSTTVQSELTMKVSGVKQQSDLLQLMRYLQHLTPVAEVQLVSVTGSDIVLNVSLRGTKQSFMQAVALGKNLQPQSKADQSDDTLVYQWVVH
ncbi:MAG: DUF2066 domain-containing protein [Gammaproteobacteria bacterium]|nr:DUF2066 domain-containing protein [Gammaproteobacteria bacterium]